VSAGGDPAAADRSGTPVPAPDGAPGVASDALTAPRVIRRLAAFVYEGVLLFGVVMIAGYLYSALTQQRHALQGREGLIGFLAIVVAIYFVTFWSRSGQTVAMKAWHIRLVDAQGRPVGQGRALLRFVLSLCWLVPPLAIAKYSGLPAGSYWLLLVMAWVFGYAALAFLRRDRQFWHDVVCGTRLINWQPALPRRPATGQPPSRA
jgi:uncharacterized RDD family membrane protein YckC